MRAIDGDRLLRELTALSHGQVWPGWTYEGIRLLIERQPTLTPPNEWISVEERLPEVGQEVLVYWRNTSQKAEHFELTHYDGDHWFLLDNTERPWIVVVAWMPLPAPSDRRPPEGEEEA